MGGKRLKFPGRKKYVHPAKEAPVEVAKKEITPEEHQQRIEMLKRLGLIKDKQEASA